MKSFRGSGLNVNLNNSSVWKKNVPGGAQEGHRVDNVYSVKGSARTGKSSIARLSAVSGERRANTMMQENEDAPTLPNIGIDDKRKILNKLGLKNINKIKNINHLMRKV